MPKFHTDDEKPNTSGRRRIGLSDMNSGRKDGPPKFGQELTKEMQREDRAMVKRMEENIAPDRIYESRCDTCNHPFRDWLEMMLIKGMPYKTLGDRVSPQVDRRSLSNHFRNHMDLQDTAFRAILEQEAKLQGQNFEEGIQDAITKRGVLEIALRKGYEDIVNGTTTVEARDLIQIAKVLGDMDSHQYEVGLDELRAQVSIFLQAIRDVCDQETQNAIGTRVAELRKREGLHVQIEAAMEPPRESIPEATLVEE